MMCFGSLEYLHVSTLLLSNKCRTQYWYENYIYSENSNSIARLFNLQVADETHWLELVIGRIQAFLLFFDVEYVQVLWLGSLLKGEEYSSI